MRRPPVSPSRPGFLLIEALVGIALFAVFLGAVGMAFLTSFQTTLSAGDRAQAVFLSERALEGAASIRDASFSSLSVGTHGLAVSAGQWVLSGSSMSADGGFTTTLIIAASGADVRRLDALTTWNNGVGRSGSVLVSQELTDWRGVKGQGNWGAPRIAGSYVNAGTPLFNAAVRIGSALFVAASDADGLYVFDVSNEASPARIAASFSLGAQGIAVAQREEVLYVLTDDASAELKAYDVSDPAGLSAGSLLGTYDLPGSARGLSLAQKGSVLYVGASADPAEAQLYAFKTASGSLTLTGSLLDPAGGFTALAVHGTTVYAACTDDVSELRVVDVSVPGSPQLATGSGYNLTDTLDGTSVAVSGTGVVLGRLNAPATEEAVLFDVAAGPVPSVPGPWPYDLGETVRALDADQAGTYVFAATDLPGKEFAVLSRAGMQTGIDPLPAFLHVTQGLGRGLTYDPWTDRVYLLTNKAVYVLAPQ